MSRPLGAWGFCFRFESDDELLAAVVERCYRDLPNGDGLAHVLRALRLPGDRYDVTLEHPDGTVEPCSWGRGRGSVLELLAWEVNRRARASMADRTVLHAAVIGGPEGAVALCGESQSGKSTLCGAAARRGWRHLSDDMCLIDVDTMTVHTYARPVMLRPGGRDHLGQPVTPPADHLPFFTDDWFVPASEMGATIVHTPQPLVAIGFLGFVGSGDGARLERLGRARTLHDLVLHSATIVDRGADAFAELAAVAAAVPGYRVGLGTADEALDLLAPLVGMPVLAERWR